MRGRTSKGRGLEQTRSRAYKKGSSLISVGSNIGRHEIELAAEEQDASAEVVEGADAASIGLEGLDDGVEALGGRVGDAVLGVVDQAAAVPAKHLGDSLDWFDAAAHGARGPGRRRSSRPTLDSGSPRRPRSFP